MFLRYQKHWFEFYFLPIFSETKGNIFLDFFEDILMLIIFELVSEGFNKPQFNFQKF